MLIQSCERERQLLLRLLRFVFVFVFVTPHLLAIEVIAQSNNDIQLLELNKPVERELAGGQSHSYRVVLAAGQYLRAVAEQRGVDVVVTLFGPDGKQVVEVDSPNGTQGQEPLSAIADVSGNYRLEVRSLEKDAPAGQYQIKIEELRPATERDKNSIAAQQVFMEGEQLREQRTFDSLRQAIKKYEEALALCRAAEDHKHEAITLNRIGFTYDLLGDKRKALDYFTQVIPRARAARDRELEATALNSIGMVHHSLGDRQKALAYYQQALPITREIKNLEGQAATLINMGMAYDVLGDAQKALDYYSQALLIVRATEDRVGEAKTLSNIGVVHQTLGDVQKALDYFNQALSIHHAIGDRAGEANVFINMGATYKDLGEPRKTLDYYLQALSLFRAAGDPVGEVTVLNNVGLTYAGLGETQKALSYYQQALPIYHATGDRNGEATLLVNLGGIYRSLGEKRKALDYLDQALPLFRAVGDRRGEATTLNNIGYIYNSLGETDKALEYHSRALPITRIIGFRDGEAQTLTNLGGDYYSMGEKQKALDYYQRALSLRRDIGDRTAEASILNNIGVIYASLGEIRKALDYYSESLPLRRATGDRPGEATTLSNLLASHRSLNNRRLAIIYGKQAAELYQQLRTDINRLDKELQKTYLRSVQITYRVLTELLIATDRLAEAQQVLNAFKDQQYFDLDQTPVAELTPVIRTPREVEFIEHYEKAIGTINRIQGNITDFKRNIRNRKPSEEEAQQLKQLEAEYQAASTEFSELLKQAETEFAKPANDENQGGQMSDTTQMQTALRQLKRDTGQTAVAVYTLAGEAKFYSLIITADDITSASSAISGKELNHKAQQLWGLLQSDAYDPRILSHELYNLIFKPIKKKLPVDTKTILWSLDGNLRYLPMGALYDGKQYLVEHYNHVNFTRADSERMTRAPSRQWTGLGLGSSQEHTVELLGSRIRFDALPGVAEELQAVFRAGGRTQGVLEGEVLPDEKFTKASMLAALARRRPVVHIASHFSFRPGDETRSFLLLGDGSVLTLAEMKAQRELFAGVELLTLSACNTAAQQANADGREIDAFAELAQRLGANAVMATLWPLADDSAPWLMGEFYRQRQLGRGMVKAEALRQAQVALLSGAARIKPWTKARREVAPIVVTGKRGASQTRADIIYVEAKKAPLYKRDRRKPFAHPYYWAPVILTGNSR
jgi:CHAT domain-containing protein/tetratricopeptide (TPR) repeat protein